MSSDVPAKDLIDFCQQNDIQVEAWRPIVWGKLDKEPIVEMAKKYGKSLVQITLRWEYQRGIRAVPKTTHKERMIENLDIFDFELTQEEMEKFRPLNTYNRTGESQTNSLKQALLNEREERNFDNIFFDF